MDKNEEYYIGLDCGTSSVGWAVTDRDYKILRAKGKSLWGSRLFEEAKTAADRRVARSARRRNRRARARLKLLQDIFSEEMLKVDPDFYIRLRESFFLEEDKEGLARNSKNTLFNDGDYTDKEFHDEYPTIWHLRKAIIDSVNNDSKHFDIRLYFLAIQHILKNRGHFLYEGEMKGGGNFSDIWDEFCDTASNFNLNITDTVVDEVEKIVTDKKKTKTDKKKELGELIFIEDGEDDDVVSAAKTALAGLIVGSKVKIREIFETEAGKEVKSFSLADGNFEEKMSEWEEELGDIGRMDLVVVAKKIYDFGILNNLLDGHEQISDAMVANYEKHQKELKKLKEALKPFKEDYDEFFKTLKSDGKTVCYNAYIGKAYTEDSNGRRKTFSVDQEAINKKIAELLDKHNITGALRDKAEKRELLPKQKGQAKGTIPRQLHGNELKVILEKLCKDFPSFAKEVPGEDKEYNTKAKKIEKIHSFRIPYYCGPLVKRKFDEKGNLVEGGKSAFSWADEEIKELVYPWNFDKLVNKGERANNFIRRMTNQCTYLLDQDVLPKQSLLYQKYMVLNELNNLKIDGKRVEDVTWKQEVFKRVFESGEIKAGNMTLKTLKKILVENGLIRTEQDLGGTAELKNLPKLGTHRDFAKILGEDYGRKYKQEDLEYIVELITILGDERGILEEKIRERLKCTGEEAKKFSKLSYKDWGNFSAKFLMGIYADVDGVSMNILDALYNTNRNLMELLGGEFKFREKIEDYNKPLKPETGKVKYSDVKKLYCSPAVKRTIWQTIKIVNELIQVKGYAPSKIFLEVTRGEDVEKKGKEGLSRRAQLLELYKNMKNSSDYKELYDQLEGTEDRDLQSKKLYLYFTQMGRCAYSGERINLEEINNTSLYDIDHIYPRSKTKDDSITRNLVLVKAELNREKTNVYPISGDIRERMRGTWYAWANAGLITKEKLARLTRGNELTADELAGFISRQIVETSQAVKAIRDLLQTAYPESRVVMVKGGQVSGFRNWFGKEQFYKEQDGLGITHEKKLHDAKLEFVKVRAINDLHHAKDAYLNIVVGNVMSETFTDNPYKWLKRDDNNWKYSMNERVLWRAKPGNGPQIKGWNYQATIDRVSEQMKRNDILWTRMTTVQGGALFDLMPVGKSKKVDGILPLKKQKGEKYNPEKYGGYNSIKGSFFLLIEIEAKGEKHRKIIQVPQTAVNNVNEYVSENYPGARVLISKIPFKSLIKLDKTPLELYGRTGNSLIFHHAFQMVFSPEISANIKKVIKIIDKNKQKNGKYEIDIEWDGVSIKRNKEIFIALIEKLEILRDVPELSAKINDIKGSSDNFSNLSLKEQCLFIGEMIKIFTCNAESAKLAPFINGNIGVARLNNDITSKDVRLIQKSPTGLFEKEIDLKTYEPE